jgi:hypothetical protein
METDTGPPLVPVIMLGLTTIAAVAMVAAALADGAGGTSDISTQAFMAWLVGSVLGLLVFAYFGTLDARRRATGRYVEPTWSPRTVSAVLTVAGWLAGSTGAFLVAQAVARR